MARKRHVVLWMLIGAAVVIAAAIVLGIVFTRTSVGVEQVRRVLIAQIQKSIQGKLEVERITTRGLLGNAVLHNFSITDMEGRPFVQADSIRLSYKLSNLLRGRIIFSRATLYEPTLVIEQVPGDTLWNFEHIFPPSPPTPGQPPSRSLIQIDQARVVRGTALVRYPEVLPGGKITPSDTARIFTRPVAGGLERELRFEKINADLPRVLWETPAEPGKLFEIASLSMLGYIWTTPVDLRDFKGVLTMRDSLIAFQADRFRLPESRGSGLGEVITGKPRTRFDIRVVGDQVAFRDLRWLYPHFPEQGGGSLVFRMQSQPVGTLWLVEDAKLHAPGTNLAGSFGIVTDDTTYFTQVNLKASPLNLELLKEVVPGAPALHGLLMGTVEVEGPIASLTTRGELRLARNARDRAPSMAKWDGVLDLEEPYGAHRLTAELREVDLGVFAPWRAELEGAGRITGRVEARGVLDRSLHLNARLTHRVAGGAESRLNGQGSFRWRQGRGALDGVFRAEPVSLDALAALAPSLGKLRGEARGEVTLKGALDSLQVGAALETSAGGLELQGSLALGRGAAPRYRAEGALRAVRLDHLLAEFPVQDAGFNARFEVAGGGTSLADMRAEVRLMLDSARLGAVEFRTADLRLQVEDGLARVDSLRVSSPVGRLVASGAIGLDAAHRGSLRVEAEADSLEALRPLLFPDAPARQEGDSTRSRVRGSAKLQAELSGSLGDLEAVGTAELRGSAVGGAEARRLMLTFNAGGFGADSLFHYRVHAAADSLDLYGEALDSAAATVQYGPAGGWAEVTAGRAGEGGASYYLTSGFRPLGRGTEFDLRELRARTGGEEWGLAAPSRIQVGADGVAVSELLFARATGAGRIRASGRLPWSADSTAASIADFTVDLQQFPIFAVRGLGDARPLAVAELTGQLRVTGTALSPRANADVTLSNLRIAGQLFDRLEAKLVYADRRLEGSLDAHQKERTILSGNARIPLDLRLIPVAERRLDEPLRLTLKGESVPAALLTPLLDGFSRVDGRIDGTLSLTGTTLTPRLGGQLVLRDGAAHWEPTGVLYQGVSGTVQVLRDQVVSVDLTARTPAGNATVSGTMDFRTLTDPTFDLMLLARNFQAARRRDVEMTASGTLRLQGRFTDPEIVDGRIRVDRATLYLDEVWRQYQIVALDDPYFFNEANAILAAEHGVRADSLSPFLANLKVRNTELEIGRDTWLRSRNLNVEVNGRLQVGVDRRRDELRLTGALNATRGAYEFFVAEGLPARRFVVRGGTVDFDGSPGINPAFNITAGYRVRTSDRQPLNVQAILTGTLENPRVALKGDGDEPISESDLLSYLVFGRPTYALAGGESRQLNSYLTGLGAGLVTPTYLGYATMLTETIAADLGLAPDYISVTPVENEGAGMNDGLRAFDPLSALGRAQVEVGNYLLGDALYMAVTRRLGQGVKALDWGARLEWRLAPTWTAEIFLEDRFARLGRFGLDQPIESRKVKGFFLFREWGF